MKKQVLRLMALVLAAVMLAGCTILEDYQRIKDAYFGQSTKFSDMEYERPDPDDVMKYQRQCIALAEEGKDLDALTDSIWDFYTEYDRFYTMYTLADIHYCIDMSDLYWSDEYDWCMEKVNEVDAGFDQLMYALAASPLRQALESEDLFGAGYFDGYEGESIWAYLSEVWECMRHTIHKGLTTTGVLEGGLGVERKASYLYNQRHIDESKATRETRIVCSYAFAASEQNAAGETIVTAPTCGSCAVVPSVLRYMQEKKGFTDEQIVRALATGGLIGNLIKQNASISGAECGCQAEVGTACAMAAAALAELFEMGIDQIEYAAELSLEHHLGLTCDPICGLVQIPCIERNAVAAMRSINSLSLANFLTGTRMISLDTVIKTMYETGKDLSHHYRETSTGGLAKFF